MSRQTDSSLLDAEQRRQLLVLARQSIETGLREQRWTTLPALTLAEPFHRPRATFVTLRSTGTLRGCCGSLEARQSLAGDVWRNAWASAFCDPRFPPLAPHEYAAIDVHISALSALEPLPPMGERELLQTLRPGIDGLVLRHGASQATFLPAVWSQLPDADEFLLHLKQKAGWSADFWSTDIRILRYTVEEFGEHGTA